jgi:hypothetical protein
MEVRPEYGGDLQLDQLLQVVACKLGDELPGAAAIQWRHQFDCGTMGLGHGSSG